MIIFFVSIFIFLCILFFVYLKKKTIIESNKNIDATYNLDEGRFEIKGTTDKFIISKNDNIQFLVEDGRIIACKDLRVNNEFMFYGGGQDGICE